MKTTIILLLFCAYTASAQIPIQQADQDTLQWIFSAYKTSTDKVVNLQSQLDQAKKDEEIVRLRFQNFYLRLMMKYNLNDKEYELSEDGKNWRKR